MEIRDSEMSLVFFILYLCKGHYKNDSVSFITIV